MIDFTKVKNTELNDMMNIIQKNVEKSELEKIYAYTIDPVEKARVFIYCYRFYYNLYTALEDCPIKIEIKEALEKTKQDYVKLNMCVDRLNNQHFNSRKYRNEIISTILKEDVDNIIDSFQILTERSTVISMTKLKGIILEGKSKEEFNKAFNKDVKQEEQQIVEDAINEEDEEESEDVSADTEAEVAEFTEDNQVTTV